MGQEKIIIVVLSYIIGFTTAFIAFGAHVDPYSQYEDFVIQNQNMGVDTVLAASTAKAVILEDGLFIEDDGKKEIVSGALTEDAEVGPGFHVAIPFYEVSPSGSYLYYCEQTDEKNDICDEYVYSLDTHTSHKIKLNGTPLKTTIDERRFQWVEGDKVLYYPFISVEEPWKLVVAE